jgi:aryl-alcohol dehydrogenase-like predicted oxidoreductase
VTGNGRALGGSVTLGPWRVRRAGYGAMPLTGDRVWWPRDRDEALQVLPAAVAVEVNHIDTAHYHGAGTGTSSSARRCTLSGRPRDTDGVGDPAHLPA